MTLNKVIIAPDSFKGALSAREATDIIADEVGRAFPDCEIVKMPIADGGEGSVDAILSVIGGDVYEAEVQSPDNRKITATFGIAGNGTAIIEMAQSSGITRQLGLNPMTSNTYGFGQLILAALDKGARRFNLCIGGSATTDGGCGMAAALGVRFENNSNIGTDGPDPNIRNNSCSSRFIPCGETLCDIVSIDTGNMDVRIAASDFTVMCDVDNPLFGKNGAAYIYGPQKGADAEQIIILDNGLRHYGSVLERMSGRCFSDIPGAGAAGGLGAGCMAFLRAKLRSGIDAILKLYDFKNQCADVDLVITGEGKLDSQSFQGKVLSGILREAGNVPVWSVCGACDCDPDVLQENGITVFEASAGISIDESMKEPEKYLRSAVNKAMQTLTN